MSTSKEEHFCTRGTFSWNRSKASLRKSSKWLLWVESGLMCWMVVHTSLLFFFGGKKRFWGKSSGTRWRLPLGKLPTSLYTRRTFFCICSSSFFPPVEAPASTHFSCTTASSSIGEAQERREHKSLLSSSKLLYNSLTLPSSQCWFPVFLIQAKLQKKGFLGVRLFQLPIYFGFDWWS